MTAEPHWRNIKKCDPVTRGELYRKSWQTHRAPGEKNHNGLRWSMREHMLQHDVVVEKVCPFSHCQDGDDNKGIGFFNKKSRFVYTYITFVSVSKIAELL